MSEETRTDYGEIEVSQEAVAMIAGATAVRCYGVVGMVPRGMRQGVSELLGRENLAQGVEVKIEGNEARIGLWVVVSYGVKIPEVARNLMEAVRYEVERMAGIRVREVNVNVVGVKVYE